MAPLKTLFTTFSLLASVATAMPLSLPFGPEIRRQEPADPVSSDVAQLIKDLQDTSYSGAIPSSMPKIFQDYPDAFNSLFEYWKSTQAQAVQERVADAAPAPPTDTVADPDPKDSTPPEEQPYAPPQERQQPPSGGPSNDNGRMTWYELTGGTTSCGKAPDGESENVVAIAPGLMGDGDASLCGKSMTITANGKSVTAEISDKCMGCTEEHIDSSAAVWKALGVDQGEGNVQVSWSVSG